MNRTALRITLITSAIVWLMPASPATAAGGGSGSSTGVAAGDFDGDGRDDMAVGVPSDTPGAFMAAGAVNVLYATGSGLTADNDDYWHQAVPGVPGTPDTHEGFGAAVAAGRFDGDRFDDLAIGAPTDGDEATDEVAGSVTILYGSPSGLRTDGARLWTEDSPRIKGETNDGDNFGSSLAVGNFGKSRRDDLAVGASGDILSLDSGDVTAGSVHVLYGSRNGLRARGNQVWHQARDGIGDSPESSDNFGASLAAADLGKSKKDDLAIGVPREGHSSAPEAGQVQVLYGGRRGLRARGDQIWRQGSPLTGAPEDGDWMGWALAAGNVGKGGRADLAIGVPLQDLAPEAHAGEVMVLYGRPGGLAARGRQRWDVEKLGYTLEHDHCGNGLLMADLGRSPRRDLIFGCEFGDASDAVMGGGIVYMLWGREDGLRGAGHHARSQDSPGIQEAGESGDGFGLSLASGNFGKGEANDLAVAAPWESFGSVTNAGVVHSIYGFANGAGLNAAGDQLWSQDAPGVRGVAGSAEYFGSQRRSTD